MRESGYIIIEGNIGVGKSTFAAALADAIRARGLRAEMIPEPDDKTNPFLADYYKNEAAFAYKTQMYLLHARFASTRYAQAGALAHKGWFILDRSYYGDICFAKVQERLGYFTSAESAAYMQAHRNMREFVELPAAAIFLDAPADVCKARIERRARPCETGAKPISIDYLRMLGAEIDVLRDVLSKRCAVYSIPWEWDKTPQEIAWRANELAEAITSSDRGDGDY